MRNRLEIGPRFRRYFKSFACHICICMLVCALMPVDNAGATQVHGGPEGLYVHQIAHFFFMFSMAILIYWLRERRLVQEKGWRFVQYAAFFFMLWNADAMIVHYLDGRNDLFEMINVGDWRGRIQIVEESGGLAFLYYLVKMDHLLSVPAAVFLYVGLRELLKHAKEAGKEEIPS